MLYNMRKVARIPVSEARKDLAKVLGLVANGTRVKITRYDRTLGGIISVEDLACLKDCEERKAAPPVSNRKQNAKTGKLSRSR